MKKRLLVTLLTVVNIIGGYFIYNLPMHLTAQADVYYPDTGWIDMGKVDSQTWYEYFVSCYQSGLHSSSSDVYKIGKYCLEHAEMASWDSNAIAKAARDNGIIGSQSAQKSSKSSTEANKGDTSSTKVSDKKTPKTNVMRYDVAVDYIITTPKVVYSSYSDDRIEMGVIEERKILSVKGESTNGFYVTDYEKDDGTIVDGYILFKGKDNIVSKEDYDAAWAQTDIVEATCVIDGYKEYTNSLDGTSYTEPIEATGHSVNANSKYKVVKPGLFKNGKTIVYCDVCGEVAKEEVINSYYESNPVLIIVASVIIGIIMIGGIVLIIRKIRSPKS